MDIETNTQIKEVRDTIVILRELNADEKVKQEAYYREKHLHDEASALGHARREGLAEGLARGEAKGSVEERKHMLDILRKNEMSEYEIKKYFQE